MKSLYFNWKRRFAELIQFRLTIYFLLILIPIVSVALYANIESRSILEHQVKERIGNAMIGSMQYLDLTVQNVEELSMIISSDSNINNLLHQLEEVEHPHYNVGFAKVLDRLTKINYVNPLISQIAVYHAASGMTLSTSFGGRRIADFEKQSWYEEIMTKRGRGIWLIPEENQYQGNWEIDPIFNTESITLFRLMDYFNVKSSNIVMITISKQKLLAMVDNLRGTEDERIYLFNNFDQVVVSTSSLSVPAVDWETVPQQAGLQTTRDSTGEVVMLRVESKGSDWSMVMIQPAKALFQLSDRLRMYTYTIIAVSILLAFTIAWVVYRGISSPLSELALGMKQVELGNFNKRLPAQRQDVFGYLNRSFNEMAREQNNLIRNNYEQQLLMTKTELRLLQSQINPHFLYNTLDSIYWKAENYDAGEISEMVLNLSKFFRTSLSKGREVFTVDETITHLKYYIRVQQLRYADHFTVSIIVEPAARTVPLYKLLLQPLVENAILHGLEKKPQGGQLSIVIGIEEDILILKVEDNGKGMDEDRLWFVKHELDQITYRNYKAFSGSYQVASELFGLKNVKARLKLYYKEEAEMTIDSILDEGTVIVIRIPLEHCYAALEDE